MQIAYTCNMAKKTEPQRPENVSIPLRMPAALADRIGEASKKTQLAKQDVMRLSLERGLDILVEQLTGSPLRESKPIAA